MTEDEVDLLVRSELATSKKACLNIKQKISLFHSLLTTIDRSLPPV